MLRDEALRQRILGHLRGFEVHSADASGLRAAAVAVAIADEGSGAQLAGIPRPEGWSPAAALLLTKRAGELLVLLGGSGSGKTTTLKMINRLIEPSEGSMRQYLTSLRTLRDRIEDRSQPLFLWVHFFDPHHPYLEHQPWLRQLHPEIPNGEIQFASSVMRHWNDLPPMALNHLGTLMTAARGLYDSEIRATDEQIRGLWREFPRLMKFNLTYRTILLGTFLLTVIFDLTVAVEVGLLLSCFFFIWRMSQLFRAEPAHDPATPQGVQVVKLFGSLFFGAVGKIEALENLVQPGTRALVLEMHRLVLLDTSGLDALEQLHRGLQRRGVALVLANVNEQPLSLMKRSGFEQRLGSEYIVPTVADAFPGADPARPSEAG